MFYEGRGLAYCSTPNLEGQGFSVRVVLPLATEKPSKEEIAKAIQKRKKGKAPGPDGIPAEILKADVNTSTTVIGLKDCKRKTEFFL